MTLFSNTILTTIVCLPLIGFFINGLFGNTLKNKFGEIVVTIVGCGMPIVSLILSVIAFSKLSDGAYTEDIYTWVSIGDGGFQISLYYDRLSALMTLIITGVGSLIHIYSVGYMHGDKGFARFFAYLNLFLFFMLLLVLGQSLLVLFVGWEGVGLVSYLLIGFWFENKEYASAGKKAFVVNRIGDAAFLLGMFLTILYFGSLDIPILNDTFTQNLKSPMIPASVTAVIALLFFIGATGKSAQIPLYTWLPDAMAGPTPVSALIHAATMVTAGIYMVVRLSHLYLSSVEVMNIIAVIGALTSIVAACIAITQTDIKKVLAYSTVSQLGLMFTAAGVGAFGVAIFHVFTHAFFKACLFLGAGSVIHAMSGEQDIMKMGRLWKKIPITFFTFAIATAAIAGIPPLAGFFSKDEILWVAYASNATGAVGGGKWWLWAIISIASFMTSFYMFRLLWLTFFGQQRYSEEVGKHIHESPGSMIFILIILATLSVFAGFIHIPEFLGYPIKVPESLEKYKLYFVIIATTLAFGGLILAKIIYGKSLDLSNKLKKAFPSIHHFTKNKFFVDEFYGKIFRQPYEILAEILHTTVDNLIDGVLRTIAFFAKLSANSFTKIQNGGMQFYVFLAFAGIIIIVLGSLIG